MLLSVFSFTFKSLTLLLNSGSSSSYLWEGTRSLPWKVTGCLNISFGECEDTYWSECCPCEICLLPDAMIDQFSLFEWVFTAWTGNDGWKRLVWHLFLFHEWKPDKISFAAAEGTLLPQKGLKIKEPNQSPKNISSYYNFVFLKSISTYLHTQRGGPSDIRAYLFICLCGQQTVRFEEASFQWWPGSG